jgi:hypothetical protein
MQVIIAEVMMVLIVLLMAVIVFVFYNGVFTALLFGATIHPENFTIIASGAPGSGGFNASAIQPVGSNPNSFPGGLTTCTGTITTTSGNLYVPPGASCKIVGAIVQSVYVNYGASLIMSNVNGQGIYDNRSASIIIANNTQISGNIGLYGTRSFSSTNSHQTSGNLVMNGVVYATFAATSLGGNLSASNCGSVQVDSNTINGNVLFLNDQVVRLTNNTISGNLTFTTDPNCYMAGNIISPQNVHGTCTGGAPSGVLDILNTGAYTVSFTTLYLNNQPWSGVSWQLATGTTEQCGNAAIPLGSCIVLPIVVPSNTMVHVTFSWVNPTPTSPVRIAMFTQVGNYLEARVDPTAGLVCSTRSMDQPREPIGFC